MLQYSLVLTALVLVATSAAHAAPSDTKRDIGIINDRLVAQYTPSETALKALHKKVRPYVETIHPDGSWKDIDYADQERTRWSSASHVSRMRELAMVHRGLKLAGTPDESIRDAALAAMAFWLEKDIKNPNWWWNEIGVQLTLGPAMLLLGDALTPELREKGVAVMKRSKWSGWTGQNLVWGTTIQILRGCAEESPEVIQEAYDRMYREVRIFPPGKESVQEDFSFHQHGPLLYSGGYGLGFATNGAQYVYHARGTQFAAPPEVVDTLVGYVLDGQQWMMRGVTFDYSAVGREITRPGKHGASMVGAAAQLAQVGHPRTEELKAFVARAKSGGKESPLAGNRHFWRSDYMTHHRPGYFVSVRMASKRNKRSEVCNSEGRKSHHLSDGVMYLYQTGQEYRDIFPVWDWQRVPGAICEQMPWDKKGSVSSHGETAFAGGVSDGLNGLAAMDFRRGALSGRMAWFMFDDAIVCLGANVACATDNPVYTSVNQCFLEGDVIASGSAKPLAKGRHELGAPGWVHHDSAGYVFLKAPKVIVANEPQTGAWSEFGVGSSKSVTRDVFSLWIDHGAQAKGGDYACVVYPGAAVAEMPAKTAAKDTAILVNTAEVQAVEHKALGIVQAAFYAPGMVTCANGRTIRVDQPCLLQLRTVDSGEELAVSNPVNEALKVTVELSGSEGPAKKIAVDLPDGPRAGSTVVTKITGG